MNEADVRVCEQSLLDIAKKGFRGLVVLGKAIEVTQVQAGAATAERKAYDAYTKMRVVTGEGTSMNVTVKHGNAPLQGHIGAFFLSRVWSGQSGPAGELQSFV